MVSTEAPGPLETLALGMRRRLTRDWPPSLSAVASWLTAANSYAAFKDLVQQYLPDQAGAIAALEGPLERVTAFARVFNERYFPLLESIVEGDAVEGYESIVTAIPVRLDSWGYEDYHDLPGDRPGLVLAALLVDLEDVDEEGIRITLLESAQEWVEREVLKKTRPYSLDFLEFALEERYRGLLYFGAHLLHATGSYFLDTEMDELYGMGCRSTGPPDWEQGTVEGLAQDWKVAQGLMDEEVKFWAWLEKDPKAHLAEVVAFLEDKWKKWQKKPKPKP